MTDEISLGGVNAIHTPCLDCVFAVYEDKTQTGCAMDMLEKYREKEDIEVIEAYNEDKEFYIINNKKCFPYKIPSYFKNRGMENSTINEKVAYVKNQMNINYALVIDIRDMSILAFKSILDSVKNKAISPSLIVMATHHTNKTNIQHYYTEINQSDINCRWKIRSLSDKEVDFIDVIHEAAILDAANCNFILSVGGNDYSNLTKIINTANSIVFDQFDSFILLANESRDIMLFNIKVYKHAMLSKVDILTQTTEHTVI